MAETIFINRKKKDENPLSHASLVREGRRLVQEMSGEIWTDYNAHDPGVTILEALCFALTDLISRTDFPVADFLTGENGAIDLQHLALHPPEEILPCRPTTLADYRRLLLDRIEKLDDIRLAPSLPPSYGGLYTIECRLDPEYGASEEQVMAKVRNTFGRNRNLCEDLETIRIVGEVPCTLNGRIEIDENASPADILAEIFHRCALYIVGEEERSPESPAEQMPRPEQLFDGPVRQSPTSGTISRHGGDGEILITDLFALIKSVDGVRNVKQLWLSRRGHPFYDALPRRENGGFLRLQIPEQPEAVAIVLETGGGREIPLHFASFQARYADRSYRHRSQRRMAAHVASAFPRPMGEWHDFQAYTSMQHLLPASYNIGRYGVPASAANEVKGRAAQLKGYLLLFDQIMANYAANLHHIRDLFAADATDGRTYHSQTVNNESFPPLAEMYPHQAEEKLGILLHGHDPFFERKNRVFDYLLALHGETFPQVLFQNFPLYTIDPHGQETALLEAKAAFLRAVVESGRDRGGATNYADNGQEMDMGGFQRRISLLLGFQTIGNPNLTAPFVRLGLDLQAIPIDKSLEDIAAPKADDPAGETYAIEPVPMMNIGADETPEDLLADCRQVMPFLTTSLPETLFRKGIDLDNFHFATTARKGQVNVWLHGQTHSRRSLLTDEIDREAAVSLVNRFRCLCLHLHRMSEGVHVVEHLLLRPRTALAHSGVDEHFYPFRLSLIFPGWTARCHDHRFRSLAEDIILMNTPAHLSAEIYWLDFSLMCRFEQAWATWRACWASHEDASSALDAASLNLIACLHSCREASLKKKGVCRG